MYMKIYYGNTLDTKIDVTHICLQKLLSFNIIYIPYHPRSRKKLFNNDSTIDKYIPFNYIFIENDGKTEKYGTEFSIKIDILEHKIYPERIDEYHDFLHNIHQKINLKHGYMWEEYDEQIMACKYIRPDNKVLEIGANYGRNSLLIASLLNNPKNLVSFESNSTIAEKLVENKNNNNFDFNIEVSALSKRKLMQNFWDTIPGDTLLDGWSWVNTMTYEELVKKYNIVFDTLVLDCEGAFYYILYDMPEILNNIKLIIVENDYKDPSHKEYVDSILIKNNFYRDYISTSTYCWDSCPINFFEVWKKIDVFNIRKPKCGKIIKL